MRGYWLRKGYRARRVVHARSGRGEPGMSQEEVGRLLGLTRSQVTAIEETALHKLRLRVGGELLERFRQAVLDSRQALDRRVPNRPWNDIDGESEDITAGSADVRG